MRRLAAILAVALAPSILLSAAKSPSVSAFRPVGNSFGAVFDIAQDDYGLMWFATADGLFRHDGYGTVQISGTSAHSLLRDSSGRMWIGTDSGLGMYSYMTDAVSEYSLPSRTGQSVLGVAEMDGNRLLVLSPSEMLLFRTDSLAFCGTLPGIPEDVLFQSVRRCGNTIYVGTRKDGVYTLDVRSMSVSKYPFPELDGVPVQDVLEQGPSTVWVATEGRGLLRVNPQSGEVRQYARSLPGGFSSEFVRTLAIDSDGDLWTGSFTELEVYDRDRDRFTVVPLHISVRSVYMDAAGGIWLGTFYDGVFCFNSYRDRFRVIEKSPSGLDDNVIGPIMSGRDGNIWIGTGRGGVNILAPDGSFRRFSRDNGLPSNDIKALYRDGDKVYVGSHNGGLCIIDARSGAVRRTGGYTHVYSIIPDRGGRLLVSTLSDIVYFDTSTCTWSAPLVFGAPPVSDRIKDVFRDSRQRLWLCSEEGVGVYAEQDGILESSPLQSLLGVFSHRPVSCVHESSDNVFWIAAQDGLFRLDETSGRIDRCPGLSGTVFFGILEDRSGNIWVSGNNGICCVSGEGGLIRNFTVEDGLSCNRFTEKSCCLAEDGTMYFGGVDGVSWFNPEMLSKVPQTPPVVITSLELFGSPVRPGDSSGILSRSIMSTGSLCFNPDQRIFSLEFSSPDYISGNISYAYRLEGFDKDWITARNTRVASYSNLPAGRYRFLVKAANADGVWNETPTAVDIRVLSPWYLRWWFILGVVLLSASAAFLMFRKRGASSIAGPAAAEEESPAVQEGVFAAKARSVVERHLSDRDFSAEVFAGDMCMSRSTLHLKMKAETGMTTTEFIRKIRFETAAKLISDGGRTLSEISALVGFSSPSYFSSSFKKYFGCLPSEYVG